MEKILQEIQEERKRQDEKWGGAEPLPSGFFSEPDEEPEDYLTQ